jgi:hypothetical protein
MAAPLFLTSFVCCWSVGSAFVLVQRGANTFERTSFVNALGSNGEGQGEGPASGKSIDDYVLNVHGGKYRFDDPSSIGSAAGRDFAESLYSSSSSTSEEDIVARDEQRAAADYNSWPNWAKRMVSNKDRVVNSVGNRLELSGSNEPLVITIQNQYRTWEPYYGLIVRFDENTEQIDIDVDPALCPFQIQTIHGKLAPNGGIDSYSDSANILVQCTQRDCTGGGSWFLIVGTEEEQWYYNLV